MAYNISEVSGNSTSTNFADWTFSLARADRTGAVDANFGIDNNFDGVADVDGSGDPIESDFYSLDDSSNDALINSFFSTTGIDADGEFTFSIDWVAFDAAIEAGDIVKNTSTGSYTRADGSPLVAELTITGGSIPPQAPIFLGSDPDVDTVTVEFLLCVARGTSILTDAGERPVETLEVGDLVRTNDGRVVPICWIGARTLSTDELSGDRSLCPVRISAGAFGEGRPDRDLIVSPQHRILFTGWRSQLLFGEESVLAPAKGLVNNTSIRVEPPETPVQYFHILFDQHEVIQTNALPTESFFPGPASLNAVENDVRAELFKLFPELEHDPSLYGASALKSLKSWEAGLLETTR